jgi:predicted enzyme related to lactoylglutathione lyase
MGIPAFVKFVLKTISRKHLFFPQINAQFVSLMITLRNRACPSECDARQIEQSGKERNFFQKTRRYPNGYITRTLYVFGMSIKVSQFTLVVNNQEDALRFYTKKVGFEKKTDFTPPGSYRWVTVDPRGQDLEFALWQMGSPDPNGWSKNWRPGGNSPIVLRVDDCRKVFGKMKSRGVQFQQAEPQQYAWGISATFSDPDGNIFSINQLPSKSSW